MRGLCRRSAVALTLLSVGLSLGACGEDPRTQIVVVVDTDLEVPGEIDEIVVEVDALRSRQVLRAERDLPAHLTLLPAQGQSGDFVVAASGRLRAEVIVAQSLRTRFVTGATRTLTIELLRACVDVRCEGAQTCRRVEGAGAACRDGFVPPESLAPWRGRPPRIGGEPDAGVDGGVAPVFAEEVFVEVAAGGDHSCAVAASGNVWCWGDDAAGQVRGGERGPPSLSPVPVLGLPPIRLVAAGDAHTCAVPESGRMRCWGDNAQGQLGNGSTAAAASIVMATQGVAGITDVLAGARHTCALLRNIMFCWGDNRRRQVAVVDQDTVLAPMAQAYEGPGERGQAAAGGAHGCRIAFEDPFVRCWGDNVGAQLGADPTGAPIAAPVGVADLGADVAELAAGRIHSCARRTDGTVLCWGDGGSGQLGDGKGMPRATPLAVALPGAASAITAGGDQTCAIVTEQVHCWGANEVGQVGDGSDDTNVRTPRALALTAASRVAMGERHGCAITGGDLSCWGFNASGQLGDGSRETRRAPVAVGGP